LDFSTFNPKIFRIFNFRAEKFWPEKLSRQKNPGVSTFKPKIFGRKKFQTVRAGRDRSRKFPGKLHAPSKGPPKKGFFPTFAAIFLKFFWRERNPYCRVTKKCPAFNKTSFKSVKQSFYYSRINVGLGILWQYQIFKV
jgi:hypothetical protein